MRNSSKAKPATPRDLASFEEPQATLALRKILALGNADVKAGRVKPLATVMARLRGTQQQ